jgi:hypothetical protein
MRARSTRLLLPALLGAAVAVSAADRALAQRQTDAPPDPRVFGTWHLNAAKSTFRPGPAYRSQIRTYERSGDGMKTRIKTTYADGHVTDVEFAAAYDSLEYPVTGSPEYDTIKLRKVDASTSEAVLGHAGKVFATARRILSEDGMRMTIVFQTDPSGGTRVDNVMVYEKQKAGVE